MFALLDRVEIELAQHAGNDNGGLPITYNDLIAFGIHDHAIGAGLREVEALGFAEIKRGIAGSATHRKPNRFRLTYRPADSKRETNEWARIASIERAEKLVSEAREGKTKALWKSPCRKSSLTVPAQKLEILFENFSERSPPTGNLPKASQANLCCPSGCGGQYMAGDPPQ